MSAMCCTRGPTLVTSDRARPRLPTITVRLSPDEKQRFAELAANRGLSECALAVATLRALLTPGTSSAPNIPSGSRREAAATVKQAVVVLAGVGRVLSRISRCGGQEGFLSPDVRQALAQTRSLVAAVEQRTSDLARADLRSWESRYE